MKITFRPLFQLTSRLIYQVKNCSYENYRWAKVLCIYFKTELIYLYIL